MSEQSSSGIYLETIANNLPDTALQCIFQYLYWKEKIMAVEAFPAWRRILQCTVGWSMFENNRRYAKTVNILNTQNYLSEEISCIERYGQFFTHAVIWIEIFHNDIHLLRALETHCHSLKSLAIYHPPQLCPSYITRNGSRYIKTLQRMISFNPSLEIRLGRLCYRSNGIQAGTYSLLKFYHRHNILQKVACLRLSHGKKKSSSVLPMNYLVYCTSLRVLECPIQYLNTQILQQLVQCSLQELKVKYDEHTFHLNYVEESTIDWHALTLIPGRNLKVDYVFRNTEVNMCQNPYTRSVFFDNIRSSISREFLRSVADLYGATLEHFAFWQSDRIAADSFSDLEDLPTVMQYMASRLTCLHTVLLNHYIPRDSLICLAIHAPVLKKLLVYEDNILFGRHAVNTAEELEELKSIISAKLGYRWEPTVLSG